jgi:hypothetical protein
MKLNTFGIRMFKDKRGSLLDPILSGAYILKTVIVIFICLVIWTGFADVMTEVITGTASESVLDPIITSLTTVYYSFDYMFPFFVGALIVISTIFAFKTGANYAWGIVSIFFWALSVLFGTVFTNTYIMISSEFPNIYANMPIMDAIMLYMKWIALVWIAVISAVMFRKDNREDEASELSRRAYGQ